MSRRILVTGAAGFVGRALVRSLAAEGLPVRAAARAPEHVGVAAAEAVHLPDLAGPVDWSALLDGVQVVVHAAGVAHLGRRATDETYERVNHLATAALATAAAKAGIERFVFLSSIGAQTGASADHVVTERDHPVPGGVYGRTKLAAERAIATSGVRHTVLRPTVIYGPQAKGNMVTLMRAARSPWPLPFGALANRRSLLGIDNLVSAVKWVMAAPWAEGQTYVVADPQALSVTEILATLRHALDRRPLLLPVPAWALAAALRGAGMAELWERMGGSLVVDPGKLLATGWQPPMEIRAGLDAMARVERNTV